MKETAVFQFCQRTVNTSQLVEDQLHPYVSNTGLVPGGDQSGENEIFITVFLLFSRGHTATK